MKYIIIIAAIAIYLVAAKCNAESCTNTFSKYESIHMTKSYVDYDIDRNVYYYNDEELSKVKVTFKNGKAYHGKRRIMGILKQWYMFVMDDNGNIYIDRHHINYMHHSSLSRGMPVAAAGMLRILNGKILAITNESGHYNMNYKYTLQFIDELKERGVDIRFIKTGMRYFR